MVRRILRVGPADPALLPDDSDAVYSPFPVSKSDAAVAAGREFLGQPKKANVNLRVRQEEEGVVSRELVTMSFTDVVEHESWVGPAALGLRPNAQLPVHPLATRKVPPAAHRVVDLTLNPGRIIRQYRAA
jgi:acetoacetate decarboxylase